MTDHLPEDVRLNWAELNELQRAYDRDRWANEWNSLPTAIDRILAFRAAQAGVADKLRVVSEWIDGSNADRDPEARRWGRLAKVSEECGEVIAAYIGTTGQNPRKGVTHTEWDVVEELLDVAFTALAAVEHMAGNDGNSMRLFAQKVQKVYDRAEPFQPRNRDAT